METMLLFSTTAPEVEGYVTFNGDCDDGDVGINPGIVEVCDGADNNCDGGVDEELPITAWYADADEDGYGNNLVVQYNCSEVEGYVITNGDCDDGDVGINPGIVEVCDGADSSATVGLMRLPTTAWFMQMRMRIGTETVRWFSTTAQRWTGM